MFFIRLHIKDDGCTKTHTHCLVCQLFKFCFFFFGPVFLFVFNFFWLPQPADVCVEAKSINLHIILSLWTCVPMTKYRHLSLCIWNERVSSFCALLETDFFVVVVIFLFIFSSFRSSAPCHRQMNERVNIMLIIFIL